MTVTPSKTHRQSALISCRTGEGRDVWSACVIVILWKGANAAAAVQLLIKAYLFYLHAHSHTQTSELQQLERDGRDCDHLMQGKQHSSYCF